MVSIVSSFGYNNVSKWISSRKCQSSVAMGRQNARMESQIAPPPSPSNEIQFQVTCQRRWRTDRETAMHLPSSASSSRRGRCSNDVNAHEIFRPENSATDYDTHLRQSSRGSHSIELDTLHLPLEQPPPF